MNDHKPSPVNYPIGPSMRYHLWGWRTILASVLICAMVFGLNVRQNQLLTQATDVMTSLHLARIELAKGFLYIILSSEPDAPYSRQEGLVLLQQAATSLEEVSANLDKVLTTEDALAFQQDLDAFQTSLTAVQSADDISNSALEIELRIAFHELEKHASAVDEQAHQQLDALQQHFTLQFLGVLGLAVVLLTSISVASIRMERAREKADQALKESEAHYRLIADNIADVIWVMDPIAGKFTYVSPSVEKLRGYTPEEVMAQPISDSLTPESFNMVSEELAQNLPAFMARGSGTETYINEVEQPCKDGSIVKTEATTTYAFNALGQVEIIGVSREITERKRAEEKLRESEEFLRLAYEAADLGIWKNDLRTGNVEFDERARVHYGFDTLYTTLSEVTNRVHPDDVERLGSEIAAATAPTGSGKFSTEYRVIHPDGSVHWLAIGVRVIFEGEGEHRLSVMGYGTSIDITSRKQTEETIQVALAKYRTLFEAFPLGITVADAAGNILETNRVAEELLGISKEEQKRREIDGAEWRIIRPDGTSMPAEEFPSVRALKEKHKVENVEMGIVKPDQSITWINVTAAPLPVEGYGVVVTYGDITERKRIDHALQETEYKYRTLVEQSPVVVYVSSSGQWLYLSPQVERVLGYSPEEYAAHPELWFNSIYPDDVDRINKEADESLHQGLPMRLEYRMYTRDGRVIWVYDEAYTVLDPQSGNPVLRGIFYDITERKWMERQIQESERNYRELVQNANSAIIRWKSDGTIVFFNEYAQMFFGYSLEEIIGKPVGILVPPTDSEGGDLSTLVQNIVDQPENFVNVINENICRDGRRVWMAWTNKPVYNENGQQMEILAVGVDITDRRRAEEEMRSSKKLLQDIIDNTSALVYVLDTEGRFLLINRPLEILFGRTSAEMIGKTRADFLSAEFAKSHRNNDLEIIRTGEAKTFEEENLEPDGRHVYLTTKFPLFDSLGRIYAICGISTDMTERKRVEDDLRRSNTELEQFAYIASHDLQEPLRTVSGMVGLLQQRYQGQLDERADEYIHFAVDASERMQHLINDLLDFSRVERKGKPFETANMEKVLQSALANLQSTIRENRASITHDPLPTVQADAGQLTLVLQNLIGNAIKFRGEKPPEIHIHAEKIENGWQFAVRDNGIGIDPQYFERVFLIFKRLHTRSKYPGTGIGLALCKKIIDRHGGKMWIESELKHGTTFFFTIPERSRS